LFGFIAEKPHLIIVTLVLAPSAFAIVNNARRTFSAVFCGKGYAGIEAPENKCFPSGLGDTLTAHRTTSYDPTYGDVKSKLFNFRLNTSPIRRTYLMKKLIVVSLVLALASITAGSAPREAYATGTGKSGGKTRLHAAGSTKGGGKTRLHAAGSTRGGGKTRLHAAGSTRGGGKTRLHAAGSTRGGGKTRFNG
jgi:hypothetical protein